MKKYLLGFLLAFITVGLVACGGGSNSPKDVAEGFTTAFYQGDVDKAVSYVYVSPEAHAKMGNRELNSKLANMATSAKHRTDEHGGLDSVKATNASLDENGKFAHVQLQITFKDGLTKTEDHRIIKDEEGNWKFDFFH